MGGAGDRVLVIGPDAGRKALAFADRGVEHVLACVTPGASFAPASRGADLPTQVELRRSGWEALDPVQDGSFDIVHCDGLMHCVLDPMGLLHSLRTMTADGGTLLIGSLMLPDAGQSELLRFVPEPQLAWWFLPGRLAFRWMVSTAGFEVDAEFGEREGPRERFPVVTGYLRARADRAPDHTVPRAGVTPGRE